MPDDAPPAAPQVWPALSAPQRRVLGVLIEKQKTSKTADAYPMTLNSIVGGCNQKSNREPVVEWDEDLVEDTLGELQKLALVMRMTGGRADRFRHLAYDQWRVTKVELAVLAELLLRGSQTEGDLRGRASRMDDVADLDTLRGLLGPLADRNLVVYLSERNRRGTVVTHGFWPADELDRERARHAGGGGPDPDPTPRGGKLDEVLAELAALKERVARLESRLG